MSGQSDIGPLSLVCLEMDGLAPVVMATNCYDKSDHSPKQGGAHQSQEQSSQAASLKTQPLRDLLLSPESWNSNSMLTHLGGPKVGWLMVKNKSFETR